MSQCAIYDASKEVRRILANISKRSFLFRECRGKKGVKTIEKRGKNLLNAVKFPNQIFFVVRTQRTPKQSGSQSLLLI